MKNIIYTIIDKNFYKLFKYFYHSLRSVNKSVPLLCITPEDFELEFSDIIQFKIKDFDSKYTAKYKIIEWNKFEEYDNYLYLDSDMYFLLDPISIFEDIEKDKNKIHGVKEDLSLNNGKRISHNFNGSVFEIDSPCFNAGNFGFHKNLKNKIKDFLNYVDKHKHEAEMDQTLYNVFFHGLISESLSNHIEIFEIAKPVKPKIVHLAGFTYRINDKQKIYKRFFRKEARGETLLLLPKESNIGLFNCGDYFEKQSVKCMIDEWDKKIIVFKDDYSVNNLFYDYVYIDNAASINDLINIIKKIYPKVKKGGVIASVTGGENGKKTLKKFIEASGLDFYHCFEDDVFFTIKL